MYLLLESINRSKYTSLEVGLDKIKKNNKDVTFLEKELYNIFNIKAKIKVVKKDFIYGMMVFPSYEEVYSIQYNVVPVDDGTFYFDRLNSLYIDIDPTLLNELSTEECTAVLLHEIGHKAFNYGIDDIFKASFNSLVKLDAPLRKKLVLLKYILSSSVFVSPFFIRREVTSDSFAVSCGYGNEIQSGLDKLLNNHRDKYNVLTSSFIASRIKHLAKTNELLNADEKEYREFIDSTNRQLLK